MPDSKLAEEHLRILTKVPHMAGTIEDKATADYVAQKFRSAGLDTQIVEYKVWMNYPAEIRVDLTAPAGIEMHGPTRERVDNDPYQDDPRVVMPFNGMSPSGDAEADVVYANYGTPEDFEKLDKLKVDVRGKIVLVRYGQNFRGVKVFVAQEHGAAGVIIYSDPADDGWRRGDKYPEGPWRPDTGVQRGSVGYMFEFPGDPTTPGVASVPSLPASQRVSPQQSAQMPKIPVTPLSYHDVWPVLQHLSGPDSPREWQGALPFTYHVGPGPAKLKMHLKQDYQFRTLWDVIGRVRTLDNGGAVDTSNLKVRLPEPDGSWSTTVVNGPIELATLFATDPVAERCYLTQWLAFALAARAGELPALDASAFAAFAASGFNLKEGIVAVLSSDAFLTPAPH